MLVCTDRRKSSGVIRKEIADFLGCAELREKEEYSGERGGGRGLKG